MEKYHQKTSKLGSKGTALIITLLVITVISTIAFSVARLMIAEIRMTTGLEDSMGAYYAAEAGIEQGLLMWRYDHDVELPTKATASNGKPQEYTLSDISSYDLKIWYRNDSYIEKASLEKDQSVEYTISNLSSLYLSCDKGCEAKVSFIPENPYKNSLEYSVIGLGNEIKKKDLLYFPQTETSISTANADKLRLHAWGSTKNYTLTAGEGDKLGGRYSFIESTGYFGSAKRKLQVKIDRASGTILGVYDFTLFGQDIITSP